MDSKKDILIDRVSAGGRNAASRRQREGFSLMELLTVMAIISILSTISLQSLAPLMSSNHVNEATALVQGQLELAQQTARTLNRSVQLRFYRNQKDTASIDTLQIVVPSENPAIESDQPIEKPVSLPQGIIIADGTNDLLLQQFSGTGPSFAAFNPAPASFYTYCYILTFSPTGAITSTDTSNVSIYPSAGSVYWSVSLVPQAQYRAKGNSIANLKNYATFYLNSVNGTFSCARP